MRLSLPTSLSLLSLIGLTVGAQPADDFFNSGAQLYISNNIPDAKQQVESGLKLYPNDVKLKKLEELLKQQQQSQSSQSQQSQSQSQQQKNRQNQKNQSKSSQSQASPPSDRNQEQQKRQERQGADDRMTPEEAKKLLDAQKGDEQFLQMKPQTPPENEAKPAKDW